MDSLRKWRGKIYAEFPCGFSFYLQPKFPRGFPPPTTRIPGDSQRNPQDFARWVRFRLQNLCLTGQEMRSGSQQTNLEFLKNSIKYLLPNCSLNYIKAIIHFGGFPSIPIFTNIINIYAYVTRLLMIWWSEQRSSNDYLRPYACVIKYILVYIPDFDIKSHVLLYRYVYVGISLIRYHYEKCFVSLWQWYKSKYIVKPYSAYHPTERKHRIPQLMAY